MARVSHMVLPVTDLRKSREWYVDNLGFAVDREQQGVIGVKDQSGLIIFLMSSGDSQPKQDLTLTIEVENVDDKYAELSRNGVKFISPPKMQFWGYGAEVLDPSGYVNHLWDKASMHKAMQGRG